MRTGAPKTSGRMRMRVMPNLVTAPNDFAQQIGSARGAITDDEERRARPVLVQQIEDLRSIVLVRSVVDCQPDGASLRHKMSEDAAKPLRRRNEKRIQHERVWSKEQD